MDKEVMKSFIERLKANGINATYDENPSPEKIGRIKKRIEEIKNRKKNGDY